MIQLLSWIMRKVGVAALLSLSLLWIVFSTICYGFGGMIQGLDTNALTVLATVSLGITWLLARSKMKSSFAWMMLIILGVSIIFSTVAGLWESGWSLLKNLPEFTSALVHYLLNPRSPLPNTYPIQPAWSDFLGAANGLLLHLASWGTGLARGKAHFDLSVSTFWWSLAIWLTAAWAALATRRWKSPLLAVAPAVSLLSGLLNYVRSSPYILLPVLAATFLLMVVVSHQQREERWLQRRMDFSTELRSDLALTTVPLVIVFMTALIVLPSPSIVQLVSSIHRLTAPAIPRFESISRSLGVSPGAAEVGFGNTQRNPGLPQSHLLGSGSELSRTPVMTIRVQSPLDSQSQASGPYYWRALSYDEYTGGGWATSPTETKSYQSGAPAIPSILPYHQLVQEQVGLDSSGEEVAYVAGDLVTIDRDFQVAWRSPQDNHDAFGARLTNHDYTTRSLVPIVSISDLRQAGKEYPDWVRERYLQLPTELPQRVRDLARELVSGLGTPYDQAKAIESYLRGYPYTLDLPKPPLEQDIVDYFLFELKKGYCDYDATAMVVLARAAGIPARLATGYAQGAYDLQQQTYFVTEADAHSWVEVYFPGIGWVEFEPTAGRPVIDRPEKVASTSQELPPLPQSSLSFGNKFWKEIHNWPVLLLVLGLILVVTWSWIDRLRLSLVAPERTAKLLFKRLRLFGLKLDPDRRPGETPAEISRAIGQQAATSQPPLISHLLRPIQSEADSLAHLYEQATYSPHPIQARQRQQVLQTWDRLNWRLWLLRFWKRLHPS